MVELPATPDVVSGIAFEVDDTPLIAAGDRLFTLDGDAWATVPTDGISALAPPLRVAILDDSTGFVLDAEGALYRRTAPGGAWEPFNDDATLASTTPVATVDGLIYMLGLPNGAGSSPMLLRGPADAAWRDSGIAVPVGCVPVPDPTSGVWCDRNDANGNRDGGLVHVDGTASDEIDLAWGAAPALGDVIGLVGYTDGALLGASLGLAPHHGEVVAVDPRSGERSQRTAGSCDANDSAFDCSDDATPGAIIYATLLAGDDLYELYARRDGDLPALLQLGEDRWFVVVPELDGNRFALASDRDGRIHAYGGTRVLRLSR